MHLSRLFSPFTSHLEAEVRRLGVEVTHALRHLHEIKEIIMVTKDELTAQIGEVKTILTEARKDVNRVADKLDRAVEAGDLSDVSAAVQELRELAQGIGNRAEQSDPEAPVEPAPVEPTEPVEPTPAPDERSNPQF